MFFYKIEIAYDGTCYYGWQKNRDLPTIAFFLEKAICQVLQCEIVLDGASRTDTGVHAKGQVALLKCREIKDLKRTLIGFNALLPKDIRVLLIEPCQLTFNPSTSSTSKLYEYLIDMGAVQLPCGRQFAWHVPMDLDLEEMKQAIPSLLGAHDFRAFTNRKQNENYEDTVRTLYSIEIIQELPRIKILVHGDRFLYKMVRNIVGTLVYVGKGMIQKEELPKILEGQKRALSGVTAPANGLTLKKIYYEERLDG